LSDGGLRLIELLGAPQQTDVRLADWTMED
jgi:hypothetical protein